jgi:hypothetical protein
MCGYEDDVNALLRDANPGLARRFRPEDAFLFADYTDPQLVHILREKVRMQVLTMARSHTSRAKCSPRRAYPLPHRFVRPVSRSRCPPPRTPSPSSLASA